MTTRRMNWAWLSHWRSPKRYFLTRLIVLAINLTFLFPYLTWAFNLPGVESRIEFENQIVDIPSKFGTVAGTFRGERGLVIHIQDLHCNFEVQSNIAGMIDHLAGRLGVGLVALEGASQPINVRKLSAFPDAEVKREVGKYFMQQGRVSGAEYYAATGRRSVRLVGIETPEHYRQGRESVDAFVTSESQGLVWDLREALDKLKPSLYTRELAGLDAKRRSFRNGEQSLLHYARFLREAGQASPGDYPHLDRYLAEAESGAPDLDVDALYEELDLLDTRIRQRVYTRPEQAELDQLEHRLDVIEKMLNISASPQDVAWVREHPEDFKVAVFAAFLRRCQSGLFLDPELFGLDSQMKRAAAFYENADLRSREFVRNLQGRMQEEQARAAILITGGYHTEQIMAQLKAEGFACLTVKPCLRRQDLVNPYFTLLRNQRTPLERLLAQDQKIMALEPFFAAWPDPHSEVPDSALSAQVRAGYRLLEVMLKLDAIRRLAAAGVAGTAALEKEYAGLLAGYQSQYPDLTPDFSRARLQGRELLIPFGPFAVRMTPKTLTEENPAASLQTAAVGDTNLIFYEAGQWAQQARGFEKAVAPQAAIRDAEGGLRAWVAPALAAIAIATLAALVLANVIALPAGLAGIGAALAGLVVWNIASDWNRGAVVPMAAAEAGAMGRLRIRKVATVRPGVYRFEARMLDSDGRPNGPEVEMEVSTRPFTGEELQVLDEAVSVARAVGRKKADWHGRDQEALNALVARAGELKTAAAAGRGLGPMAITDVRVIRGPKDTLFAGLAFGSLVMVDQALLKADPAVRVPGLLHEIGESLGRPEWPHRFWRGAGKNERAQKTGLTPEETGFIGRLFGNEAQTMLTQWLQERRPVDLAAPRFQNFLASLLVDGFQMVPSRMVERERNRQNAVMIRTLVRSVKGGPVVAPEGVDIRDLVRAGTVFKRIVKSIELVQTKSTRRLVYADVRAMVARALAGEQTVASAMADRQRRQETGPEAAGRAEPYGPEFTALLKAKAEADDPTILTTLEHTRVREGKAYPQQSVSFALALIAVYFGDTFANDLNGLMSRIMKASREGRVDKTAALKALTEIGNLAGRLRQTAQGHPTPQDIHTFPEAQAAGVIARTLALRASHRGLFEQFRARLGELGIADPLILDEARWIQDRADLFFSDLAGLPAAKPGTREQPMPVFHLGLLIPLVLTVAELLVQYFIPESRSGWMAGLTVATLTALAYALSRIRDTLAYLLPGTVSVYTREDFQRDLGLLPGLLRGVRLPLDLPEDWQAWLTGETSVLPGSLAGVEVAPIRGSPWRLLWWFGRGASQQGNRLSFQPRFKQLSLERRLAVLAHELTHLAQSRQAAPARGWRRLPGLSWLHRESQATRVEEIVEASARIAMQPVSQIRAERDVHELFQQIFPSSIVLPAEVAAVFAEGIRTGSVTLNQLEQKFRFDRHAWAQPRAYREGEARDFIFKGNLYPFMNTSSYRHLDSDRLLVRLAERLAADQSSIRMLDLGVSLPEATLRTAGKLRHSLNQIRPGIALAVQGLDLREPASVIYLAALDLYGYFNAEGDLITLMRSDGGTLGAQLVHDWPEWSKMMRERRDLVLREAAAAGKQPGDFFSFAGSLLNPWKNPEYQNGGLALTQGNVLTFKLEEPADLIQAANMELHFPAELWEQAKENISRSLREGGYYVEVSNDLRGRYNIYSVYQKTGGRLVRRDLDELQQAGLLPGEAVAVKARVMRRIFQQQAGFLRVLREIQGLHPQLKGIYLLGEWGKGNIAQINPEEPLRLGIQAEGLDPQRAAVWKKQFNIEVEVLPAEWRSEFQTLVRFEDFTLEGQSLLGPILARFTQQQLRKNEAPRIVVVDEPAASRVIPAGFMLHFFSAIGARISRKPAGAIGKWSVTAVDPVAADRVAVTGYALDSKGRPDFTQPVKAVLTLRKLDESEQRRVAEAVKAFRGIANASRAWQDQDQRQLAQIVGLADLFQEPSAELNAAQQLGGLLVIEDVQVVRGPPGLTVEGLGLANAALLHRDFLTAPDEIFQAGLLHELGHSAGLSHGDLRGEGAKARATLNRDLTPREIGFVGRILGGAAQERLTGWLQARKQAALARAQAATHSQELEETAEMYVSADGVREKVRLNLPGMPASAGRSWTSQEKAEWLRLFRELGMGDWETLETADDATRAELLSRALAGMPLEAAAHLDKFQVPLPDLRDRLDELVHDFGNILSTLNLLNYLPIRTSQTEALSAQLNALFGYWKAGLTNLASSFVPGDVFGTQQQVLKHSRELRNSNDPSLRLLGQFLHERAVRIDSPQSILNLRQEAMAVSLSMYSLKFAAAPETAGRVMKQLEAPEIWKQLAHPDIIANIYTSMILIQQSLEMQELAWQSDPRRTTDLRLLRAIVEAKMENIQTQDLDAYVPVEVAVPDKGWEQQPHWVRGAAGPLIFFVIKNAVTNAQRSVARKYHSLPVGKREAYIRQASVKVVFSGNQIRVQDSGDGIARTIAPDIFQRGVTEGKGKGLGMYSALRTAARLGAKFRYESEAGVGTTLVIDLQPADPGPWDEAYARDVEGMTHYHQGTALGQIPAAWTWLVKLLGFYYAQVKRQPVSRDELILRIAPRVESHILNVATIALTLGLMAAAIAWGGSWFAARPVLTSVLASVAGHAIANLGFGLAHLRVFRFDPRGGRWIDGRATWGQRFRLAWDSMAKVHFVNLFTNMSLIPMGITQLTTGNVVTTGIILMTMAVFWAGSLMAGTALHQRYNQRAQTTGAAAMSIPTGAEPEMPDAAKAYFTGRGWTILKFAGEGGFGTVFQARDPEGRTRALKVSRPGKSLRNGKIRELLALLEGRTHPAILLPSQLGEIPVPGAKSLEYQVLEWKANHVDWAAWFHRNLADPRVKEKFPDMFSQILDAVLFLHFHGAGHGDLVVPYSEETNVLTNGESVSLADPQPEATWEVTRREDATQLAMLFHEVMPLQELGVDPELRRAISDWIWQELWNMEPGNETQHRRLRASARVLTDRLRQELAPPARTDASPLRQLDAATEALRLYPKALYHRPELADLLDDFDREHYEFVETDPASGEGYWRSKDFQGGLLAGTELVLGSWEDVEKHYPNHHQKMKRHVVERFKHPDGSTVSFYYFDDHGFSVPYAMEAVARGEMPARGNTQVFLDEHYDFSDLLTAAGFEDERSFFRLPRTLNRWFRGIKSFIYMNNLNWILGSIGFLKKHIWVFDSKSRSFAEQNVPDEITAKNLQVNDHEVRYLAAGLEKYFEITERPMAEKALINIDTDVVGDRLGVGDVHRPAMLGRDQALRILSGFLYRLAAGDRVAPASFHANTTVDVKTYGDVAIVRFLARLAPVLLLKSTAMGEAEIRRLAEAAIAAQQDSVQTTLDASPTVIARTAAGKAGRRIELEPFQTTLDADAEARIASFRELLVDSLYTTEDEKAETPKDERRTWRDLYHPDSEYYVLYQGDEAVAFMALKKIEPEDTSAEVIHFHTRYEAWRQGFGTRLQLEILRMLRSRGVKTLDVPSVFSDRVARGFNERMVAAYGADAVAVTRWPSGGLRGYSVNLDRVDLAGLENRLQAPMAWTWLVKLLDFYYAQVKRQPVSRDELILRIAPRVESNLLNVATIAITLGLMAAAMAWGGSWFAARPVLTAVLSSLAGHVVTNLAFGLAHFRVFIFDRLKGQWTDERATWGQRFRLAWDSMVQVHFINLFSNAFLIPVGLTQLTAGNVVTTGIILMTMAVFWAGSLMAGTALHQRYNQRAQIRGTAAMAIKPVGPAHPIKDLGIKLPQVQARQEGGEQRRRQETGETFQASAESKLIDRLLDPATREAALKAFRETAIRRELVLTGLARIAGTLGMASRKRLQAMETLRRIGTESRTEAVLSALQTACADSDREVREAARGLRWALFQDSDLGAGFATLFSALIPPSVSLADLGSGPVAEFAVNMKAMLEKMKRRLVRSVSLDNAVIDRTQPSELRPVSADATRSEDLAQAGIAESSQDLVTINNIVTRDLLAPGLKIMKPGGLMMVTFAASDDQDFVDHTLDELHRLAGLDTAHRYDILEVRRPEDYPASNQRLKTPYPSKPHMLVVVKHAVAPGRAAGKKAVAEYVKAQSAAEAGVPFDALMRRYLGDEVAFADLGSGAYSEFARNLKPRLEALGIRAEGVSVDAIVDRSVPEALRPLDADATNLRSLERAGIMAGSRDLVTINNIVTPHMLEPALRLLKQGGVLMVTFAKDDKDYFPKLITDTLRQVLEQDQTADYDLLEIQRPQDYPTSNQQGDYHYASAERMLLVVKRSKSEGRPADRSKLAEYQRIQDLGSDLKPKGMEFNAPASDPARLLFQIWRLPRVLGMGLLYSLFLALDRMAALLGHKAPGTAMSREAAQAYLSSAVRRFFPLNAIETRHFTDRAVAASLLANGSLAEKILGQYRQAGLAVDGGLVQAAIESGRPANARIRSLVALRSRVAASLIRQVIYYRSSEYYGTNLGSRVAAWLGRGQEAAEHRAGFARMLLAETLQSLESAPGEPAMLDQLAGYSRRVRQLPVRLQWIRVEYRGSQEKGRSMTRIALPAAVGLREKALLLQQLEKMNFQLDERAKQQILPRRFRLALDRSA